MAIWKNAPPSTVRKAAITSQDMRSLLVILEAVGGAIPVPYPDSAHVLVHVRLPADSVREAARLVQVLTSQR